MRLCPKIGCFYITRNNPRELLNIIRELREENMIKNVKKIEY